MKILLNPGGSRCDLRPDLGSAAGESVQPDAKCCAPDERAVLVSLLYSTLFDVRRHNDTSIG